MLADLWIYHSKSDPDHQMLFPVRKGETPTPENETVECFCGQPDMIRDSVVSKTTEYEKRCLFTTRSPYLNP